MTLKSYTNISPGPRLLWVETTSGPENVTLQPGETQDFEIVPGHEKTVEALVDMHEIFVGPAGSLPPAPVDEKQAALQAEYDRGFAEGRKKAAGK